MTDHQIAWELHMAGGPRRFRGPGRRFLAKIFPKRIMKILIRLGDNIPGVGMTREIKAWLEKSNSGHRDIPADRAWADGRRKEYLNGKLSNLRKLLTAWRILAGRAAVARDDFDMILCSEVILEIERDIKRCQGALKYMSSDAGVAGDGITADMIERARGRDIREVVDATKGMVRCPFHKDGKEKKPSMSVTKGFGFCFVCQKSINAIDWLVKVEGMDFVAAVRRLTS